MRSILEDGAVALDRERRIAAAQLRGELAPRGPRPALEDAGERQVGHASRARTSGASSSSSVTVSARHSTTSSLPTSHATSASASLASASTPVSSRRPPLRYSGKPVSSSRPVTVMPAHSNGSNSEYASHCDNLWNGTQPAVGPAPPAYGCRHASPSGTPSSVLPVSQIAGKTVEQRPQDRRRGNRSALSVARERIEQRARPRQRTEDLAPLGQRAPQAAQQRRAAVESHQRIGVARLEQRRELRGVELANAAASTRHGSPGVAAKAPCMNARKLATPSPSERVKRCPTPLRRNPRPDPRPRRAAR